MRYYQSESDEYKVMKVAEPPMSESEKEAIKKKKDKIKKKKMDKDKESGGFEDSKEQGINDGEGNESEDE